jgi:LmbE family N-acetylglucosaminyl deacetylase
VIDLMPEPDPRRALRVLCIGAHCDDIEIGCGGTLQVLQQRKGGLQVDWAVMCGSEERRREARRALTRLVKPAARGACRFGDFPDGRLPAQYAQLKDFFLELRNGGPPPDLVLCHERDDRHQDHRLVNEMTWTTFRDQLILEYEIPKWDGGLGQPNVYVAVARTQAEKKVRTLLSVYQTQRNRDWFTADTFLGLMRLRGVESRSASGYAEAFHGRKLRFSHF